MDIYILAGKWPYPRYGIEDYVDQKIIYIPEKNIKFCADDREIRTLFSKEQITLERLLGILNESHSDCVQGHILRARSTIFMFRKKINPSILEEISLAYNNQNRKFFFLNSLFQKPSE